MRGTLKRQVQQLNEILVVGVALYLYLTRRTLSFLALRCLPCLECHAISPLFTTTKYDLLRIHSKVQQQQVSRNEHKQKARPHRYGEGLRSAMGILYVEFNFGVEFLLLMKIPGAFTGLLKALEIFYFEIYWKVISRERIWNEF